MLDTYVNVNYTIEELFPTTIYMVKNCCNFLINDLKISVKQEVEKYSLKTDVFYVNSTHTSFETLEEYPFSALKQFINYHSLIYLNKMGYEVNDKILQIQMWCNTSQAGGFLFPHTHAGSILSGVYYVQCSEDDKILFYNAQRLISTTLLSENKNNYSSDCATYSCISGTLMIWNSNLLHGNPRRESEEEKISIAFNVMF